MGFGFLHASSIDFQKSKDSPHIVQSHNGFTSYLLIVDVYSWFIWVFPTASKTPLLNIINAFLQSQKIIKLLNLIYTLTLAFSLVLQGQIPMSAILTFNQAESKPFITLSLMKHILTPSLNHQELNFFSRLAIKLTLLILPSLLLQK